MKLNNKAFSTVEALLVVVIVAIIGGTGYYVWHNNQQANATLDTASKSTENSDAKHASAAASVSKLSLNGGQVTFTIPSSWTHTEPSGACQENVYSKVECVDSLEVSPNDANKAKTGDDFGARVSFDTIDASARAKDWYWKEYNGGEVPSSEDKFNTLSINGYDTFTRTENNNSYTDVWYVLHNGTVAVVVYSRISATHYAPGGTTVDQHTDNTKYLSQIVKLVHSVEIR